MHSLSKQAGTAVREYRKIRKMSLEQLARMIQKSRSTVAKYETGEISMDLDTLYEISQALNAPVEAFFAHLNTQKKAADTPKNIPEFFRQGYLYGYYWDGRNNTLNASLLKIGAVNGDNGNQFQASLYMNVKDWEHPYVCENTYLGTIEFHHILTSLNMSHRDTPLEHIMITIPENFSNTQVKMALFSGVSFRPFMPCALKMLFSQTLLASDDPLMKNLLINRDDIRKLKMYNIFTITQDW